MTIENVSDTARWVAVYRDGIGAPGRGLPMQRHQMLDATTPEVFVRGSDTLGA
jgi:hypothetical protein